MINQSIIDRIKQLTNNNIGIPKTELIKIFQLEFNLIRARSVYYNDDFSIRFSSVSDTTLKTPSNTILAISTIKKFDSKPLILCIIYPDRIRLQLFNSTLIKKVSHSAKQLSKNNLKGSVLGHDIMEHFKDLDNNLDNLPALILYHQQISWEENIERIIEANKQIRPSKQSLFLTQENCCNILNAPTIALNLSQTTEYQNKKEELYKLIQNIKSTILEIANQNIDNVNERGNRIEQVITKSINKHDMQDLEITFSNNITLYIDIKTKVVGKGKSSNPKYFKALVNFKWVSNFY